MFRDLRADYSRYNLPSGPTIGEIVKKFKEFGCVTDFLRLTHHRNARSNENVGVVS